LNTEIPEEEAAAVTTVQLHAVAIMLFLNHHIQVLFMSE
jgi:hypothetical protein